MLTRRGFTAESFDSTHAYFNEIARHAAARHGFPVIDLAAAPWDGKLLYDGLHFSDPGARRVAEIAVPQLVEQIRLLRAARAEIPRH